MNDPKITLDTVRLANGLTRGVYAHGVAVLNAVQDAAALERLGRRVKALNTQYANTGSEATDRGADRASDKAAKLAAVYGAKFSRYGRGSGLWPFVEANGSDFSL